MANTIPITRLYEDIARCTALIETIESEGVPNAEIQASVDAMKRSLAELELEVARLDR